jgi:hypothetical protein
MEARSVRKMQVLNMQVRRNWGLKINLSTPHEMSRRYNRPSTLSSGKRWMRLTAFNALISSHSSCETSDLKEPCRQCQKKRSAHKRRADLQDVYALSRYPTVHLVLLIEMPAKHLSRLVYRVLDLDSNAAARLRPLYKLDDKLIKTASSQKIIYMRTSIVCD